MTHLRENNINSTQLEIDNLLELTFSIARFLSNQNNINSSDPTFYCPYTGQTATGGHPHLQDDDHSGLRRLAQHTDDNNISNAETRCNTTLIVGMILAPFCMLVLAAYCIFCRERATFTHNEMQQQLLPNADTNPEAGVVEAGSQGNNTLTDERRAELKAQAIVGAQALAALQADDVRAYQGETSGATSSAPAPVAELITNSNVTFYTVHAEPAEPATRPKRAMSV